MSAVKQVPCFCSIEQASQHQEVTQISFTNLPLVLAKGVGVAGRVLDELSLKRLGHAGLHGLDGIEVGGVGLEAILKQNQKKKEIR